MKAFLLKQMSIRTITVNEQKEGTAFCFVDIDINDFKDMQKAVGGSIESWNYISKLYKKGIDLFCNDEGKINNLLPAIIVVSNNSAKSEIVESLCGNILFCCHNDKGELIDMTDSQKEFVRNAFYRIFYIVEERNVAAFAVCI